MNNDIKNKWRKKPVVIEARQFSSRESTDNLVRWCGGVLTNKKHQPLSIEINTLEGTMSATAGDWIIKGVNGEFYPCKDDIFKKSYDAVTDDADLENSAARAEIPLSKLGDTIASLDTGGVSLADRDWLEDAIISHGGEVTDSGGGCGGMDLGYTFGEKAFDIALSLRGAGHVGDAPDPASDLPKAAKAA